MPMTAVTPAMGRVEISKPFVFWFSVLTNYPLSFKIFAEPWSLMAMPSAKHPDTVRKRGECNVTFS